MVSESGRALLAQSGGGSLSGASAAQLALHPPRRFDDSDLSSILDPGKRFVVFKASVKGSYLVLDMRNSKSTSEGDEGRETTRRGILDRIRFAEEQTSGGSLAEHGGGLSVIDTIVQRYDGAVSLERSKAGFRMSVMVDLAAQT